MFHLIGFMNFVISAFRQEEEYQPRQSCTGFDMVDGILIPRNVVEIDHERL